MDQTTPTHTYQHTARTLTFLTNDNNVLLLKAAPTKTLWPNLYNGIGGHVEPGETIWDSAIREIREETGIYTIDNLLLRGIITIDQTTNTGIILFVFSGTTLTTELTSSREGTPAWIPIINVPEISCVEDVPTILRTITSMQPHHQPFYAHYHYQENNHLHITLQHPSSPHLPESK
jgi:8-oxo-dGTP diphosphatase